VGRVAKCVADTGNVVATPHGRRVALLDLLGNQMPEDRNFVAEVVVDAEGFVLEVGRRHHTFDELRAAGGSREDALLPPAARNSSKVWWRLPTSRTKPSASTTT